MHWAGELIGFSQFPPSWQSENRAVKLEEGAGGFVRVGRSQEGELYDLSGRTVQALSIAMSNDLINEKMYFS